MSEWKPLNTLQEVAAAQAAGEEIEVSYRGHWCEANLNYRSRPRKKVKQIVLREALFGFNNGRYTTHFCNEEYVAGSDTFFIRWLDTPERVTEVAE